jgi:basic amino acid/polyamine antiporter, APA family
MAQPTSSPASADTDQFNRSLNLLDSTLLVAGGMIGSGIFIVSAEMARNLGSAGWLLGLWVLTGIMTVAAALSYGELAGMMPKAGGQYVYLQRAFNPLVGFVYGWTTFAVIQTGTIAAVAVAFTKFTAVFLPALNPELTWFAVGPVSVSVGKLFAIGSIILLTWLNSRGVQSGKLVQNVFTSAKLVALFGLILLGIGYGLTHDTLAANFRDAWSASETKQADGSNLLSVVPLAGFGLMLAFGRTMIGALFSADAWNNVTFIAGEIKNPRRNIPLSLFFGTLLVTSIYILANIAYLSVLPLSGTPDATTIAGRGMQFAEFGRIGTAAASVILGNSALGIMAVLIMISTFGCNNGLILAGARLYYAMASDGLFLRSAGTLNKNAVPGVALWLQCAWASMLCLSGQYGDLLDYCTFAALIFYAITIIGLFRLRRTEPNTERPYRAFGYPLVPAFYILTAFTIALLLLIDERSRFNTGMGLVIAAVGIPIYFLTKRRR